MRNSCKFVRDWHAKVPAFAGKYTCKLQAKTLESQFKNTRQTQTKINANTGKNPYTIAGKNICNFRQSAITLRVKSSTNCKKVSLNPAEEVTRDLRAL